MVCSVALRCTMKTAMIRSFRHKGIERFFLTGSKAGIQPSHATKLNEQLTVLNAATKPSQMNIPGWEFHSLTGASYF